MSGVVSVLMGRRLIVLVAAVLTVGGSVPISPAMHVAAASPIPAPPHALSFVTAPPRLVSLQGLPLSSPAAHPNRSLPFLPRHQASKATARLSGVLAVPDAQLTGGSAPKTQQQ